MSPGTTARTACLLLLAGAAGPLRAQATADRARLVVGLGIAFHGGGHIWTQDGQTIIDQAAAVDTASVGRNIQSQFGLSFMGAYFPTDQWGVIGEVQFLGLHYVDSCRLLTNHSSGEAQQICRNIEGRGHDGTAVTLTVGGIFRPWPKNALSPYLRASGGLNVSQNSSVRMIGTWVTSTFEEADYYVFGDPSPGEITPMLALGGGITTPTGRGSQFRLEVRDNVVYLRHPVGTQSAPDPGLTPPTKVLASHLFSLNLGFEIVLEKKRGHRY